MDRVTPTRHHTNTNTPLTLAGSRRPGGSPVSVRPPRDMDLFPLLLCVAVLSAVQGVKKCRLKCNEVYTPVCGRDRRLGYTTFCSTEAMEQCNESRGYKYRKIADGPCYPSVREWRKPPVSQESEEESLTDVRGVSSSPSTPARMQDAG